MIAPRFSFAKEKKAGVGRLGCCGSRLALMFLDTFKGPTYEAISMLKRALSRSAIASHGMRSPIDNCFHAAETNLAS